MAVLACVLGLYGGAAGLARALPPGMGRFLPPTAGEPLGGQGREYDGVRRHVADGDVVMADRPLAGRILAGWGVRAVAPPYPYPFAPDERRRRRDHRAMFAAGTSPGERLRIARTYGVRCLLAREPPPTPGFRTVATASAWALTCAELYS